MRRLSRARDYAYGVKDCLALAAGKHQNPKQCQGTCNPRESFENADTLALVAAGMLIPLLNELGTSVN